MNEVAFKISPSPATVSIFQYEIDFLSYDGLLMDGSVEVFKLEYIVNILD